MGLSCHRVSGNTVSCGDDDTYSRLHHVGTGRAEAGVAPRDAFLVPRDSCAC